MVLSPIIIAIYVLLIDYNYTSVLSYYNNNSVIQYIFRP